MTFTSPWRGHTLCQFLVRLPFCFFADDTGIFPKDPFKFYLRHRTAPLAAAAVKKPRRPRTASGTEP